MVIIYVTGHVTGHNSDFAVFEAALIKKRKATIYDVAEKAGVSRQTVSRVLNNRLEVSDETRQRVKDVMAELNFQRNAVALSLSRQRSYLFGVVISGLKYLGPSQVLSGITNKAEELGYGLLLKEVQNSNSANIIPIVNWFKSHQADGIIWAAPEIEENRHWINEIFHQFDIPIIFLTMEEERNVTIVAHDNFAGAKAAVNHLIQKGRKNIAHVTGPLDWWEARQRKLGWESALAEAGMQVDDRMWAQGSWSSKSGKRAFLELNEKFPEVDGIFAGNDQMALGILQAASDFGKTIPHDLSIVGFDGTAESEFYIPPLSTVYQNWDELGRIAVTELVSQVSVKLTENKAVEPKYITVQPELIIRQSS